MTRLNPNLPFVRTWTDLRDRDLITRTGENVAHALGWLRYRRDGDTYHGYHCAHTSAHTRIGYVTIAEASTLPWYDCCADDTNAHEPDARLLTLTAINHTLERAAPLGREDAVAAVNRLHAAARLATRFPLPHFDQLRTQLEAACNTDSVRDGLVGYATVLAACTHLTPARRTLANHIINDGQTDRALIEPGFARDIYQHSRGDIHATIDQIAAVVTDSQNGGLAAAHTAADNASLVPHLIVTNDGTVAWFAHVWPAHRGNTTTVFWAPAVIADTRRTTHTFTYPVDPAVVTAEFLGTCGACVDATSGDSASIDDAVATAVLLHT
jgi:hypothetical protein